MNSNDLEYVGFWARVGASLIDTFLMGVIIWPVLTLVYGTDYWVDNAFIKGPLDFLLTWVLPGAAVILFWVSRQATPGKMAIGARIVDQKTGKPASAGQLVGRYFGYYASSLPLFLGIFWVAFDPRKQGWHDKLAGTVVVRLKNRSPEPVKFQS